MVVERRVEQDRDAGQLLEFGEQSVIAWVLILANSLWARRAVSRVHHGSEVLGSFRADVERVDHKRRWLAIDEVRVSALLEHRWRERTPLLAVFDESVGTVA